MAVLEGPCENVLIAGDIHGDFDAFERAVEIYRETENSMLVFLGDYADRGGKGLEVIESLAEMIGPRVVALKGNHEDYVEGSPMFYPWDFGEEVERKRGVSWTEFYKKFEKNFLRRLSLSFVIPGLALCVHGGVCSRIRELKDLEDPDRETEECLLWNDPMELSGELPNPRGAGLLFGPDVTEKVLRSLGLKVLIRSHEPQKASDGPAVEQGGRVITLSTTGVYGGRPFLLKVDLKEEFNPTDLCKSVVFL